MHRENRNWVWTELRQKHAIQKTFWGLDALNNNKLILSRKLFPSQLKGGFFFVLFCFFFSHKSCPTFILWRQSALYALARYSTLSTGLHRPGAGHALFVLGAHMIALKCHVEYLGLSRPSPVLKQKIIRGWSGLILATLTIRTRRKWR
jgi:hypothetical protein